MTKDSNFDCVVVGAGIIGLATATALAEQKKNVLLLEQFPIPHTRGSSMGQTRITRLTYRQPHYVDMMVDAHNAWRKLEQWAGVQLYRQTGVLALGNDSTRLNEYETAMRQIAHDSLNREQLHERVGGLFDVFAKDGAIGGVFESDGGLLLAGRCVVTFMQRFKSLGGVFKDNCAVTSVNVTPNLVQITAADGSVFSSPKIVITVGPWAPKFLKKHFDLELPIQVHRTITTFWRENTPGQYAASNGTPVVQFGETAHPFYFKPTLEYDGLLQYGVHWGLPANPDAPAASCPELLGEYIAKCQRIAKKYSLNIDTTSPAVVEPCFYTECIDRDFILDVHPHHPNVVIGTGFTGHGFKLAPIVGKILASYVTEGPCKYALEPFKISRFQTKSKM